MRVRFGLVLLLVLLCVLLATSSLRADSVQPSLVFQSLHQSMWGPGAAPPPAEHRLVVFNESWNHSTSGYPAWIGPYWSEDTYLFGEVEFGAQARAATNGEIGLWFDLKLEDIGSVDVTYPVTPRVEFPDANSFRAGDTVAIRTSWSLDPGYSLDTRSPQASLAMDAKFRLFASAQARLCAFGCVSAPPNGYSTVDINAGEFNIFTVRTGSSFTTPPWLPSPVSGSIGVPYIETDGSLDGNGRSLASAGSQDFLHVELDLADIAFSAAKSPIGPHFDTNDYPGMNATGVGFHYDILTVSPSVTLSARQNFRFDPDLKVKLQFAQPLEHWVVSGGAIGPTSTASSVEVRAGDTIYVKYPATDKQPTNIDPTFRLDNRFESTTGFGLAENIHISTGEIGMTVPSLEIFPELCFPAIEVAGIEITPEFCTPSVSTPAISESAGPLYSHDEPLGAQDLGNLFSSSWQLEGFAPVTVDAFALDPENPIVLLDQQTGASRNLGGGQRQVAYAFDFANGGDVKLSDVHLTADLAGAYAAAYSYKVDRILGCDVTTNADFNGAANKELLAPGTSLEVGAKGRVILIVSVWPRPDPPVYTLTSVDDGTSPLGTFVTKTDSSDVLLGPGIIEKVSDYVLFGEHFVKLDAIANTSGHIGSNDFVEVKNGNSAIVAGDLRAGRTIKVQGAIAADYAYAGRNIDVVQKAALKLSGNMKAPFAVPAYTIAAPAPLPPLQGNVWVGDNQSRHLQPGHYGDVTVNAGATLTLDAGTYSFESLAVANNATVRALGSSRAGIIHVVSPGEVRIGQNARVRGTLIAPLANVTFEERSRLEGSAAARSITLRPGASASYHFDCDKLVDPDCDGSPNCGQ